MENSPCFEYHRSFLSFEKYVMDRINYCIYRHRSINKLKRERERKLKIVKRSTTIAIEKFIVHDIDRIKIRPTINHDLYTCYAKADRIGIHRDIYFDIRIFVTHRNYKTWNFKRRKRNTMYTYESTLISPLYLYRIGHKARRRRDIMAL